MHTLRLGPKSRSPNLLGRKYQHRRSIADHGVEQDIEHRAASAAFVGLRARFGVHVAIEAILADIEIKGRQVFIGEIGE